MCEHMYISIYTYVYVYIITCLDKYIYIYIYTIYVRVRFEYIKVYNSIWNLCPAFSGRTLGALGGVWCTSLVGNVEARRTKGESSKCGEFACMRLQSEANTTSPSVHKTLPTLGYLDLYGKKHTSTARGNKF